jgi:hypothetical protein
MSAFSLTPVLPEAPLLGALPTEAVSKLREISDRPRGAKISIISPSLDGPRARKSERNRSV